jgi:hypothetical protein
MSMPAPIGDSAGGGHRLEGCLARRLMDYAPNGDLFVTLVARLTAALLDSARKLELPADIAGVTIPQLRKKVYKGEAGWRRTDAFKRGRV